MNLIRVSAPLLILAAACGDPDWVGPYTTTGSWNLSGPLSDGRSAGDAIADLIIDHVVAAAPIPDGTKEDLAVELSDLFRLTLKNTIDTQAPAELRPGGSLSTLLASSLADVKVESRLELEEGGDGVEGVETFAVFEIGDATGPYRIGPSELGQVAISAEWAGEEDDGQFILEPHEVGIQFGQLVKLVAARAIDAAQLESIEAGVLSAVDCGNLVNAILDGKPSLEIDVALFTVSIDASTLTSACSAVRSLVEDQALGLFGIGTKVEVGGSVGYLDENEDGRVELKSSEDFGGHLKVAPKPIAPKVKVVFQALHD